MIIERLRSERKDNDRVGGVRWAQEEGRRKGWCPLVEKPGRTM